MLYTRVTAVDKLNRVRFRASQKLNNVAPLNTFDDVITTEVHNTETITPTVE